MDVNNTSFHLLLGQRDWDWHLPGTNVSWDPKRACISLDPLLYRFPVPAREQPLGYEQRRGAARDRYGNWYSIREDEMGIDFLPPKKRSAEAFWSVEAAGECEDEGPTGAGFRPLSPQKPPPPTTLRGLAVTARHYLVVGTIDPAGLLIFDLHAGGPPLQLAWPASIPFHPFDLAPRPDGGVWILDVDAEEGGGAPARYWALDRYFRVEAQTYETAGSSFRGFTPVGEPKAEQQTYQVILSDAMALPLPSCCLVALEALPDDTVLVLRIDPADGSTRLARYSFAHQRGPEVVLDRLIRDQLAGATGEDGAALGDWRGYDLAFVARIPTRPREVRGTLFVVGNDGNQAFAFDLVATEEELSVALQPRFFPLRRFSGKGLVAGDDYAYYDLDDRWLTLAAQPRPRYEEEGSLVTRSDLFDSNLHDCVWHRLFLDACIPGDTEVRIESRAANEVDLLEHESWREEPRPYLRGTGSEVPFHQAFSTDVALPDGAGTWELLFREAKGRYLQLRVTLAGNRRSTPRIYAMRVHYPRFSYVNEYLPDVYQKDATSASFLERFLANVEGTYTELEGRIAEVQSLFDVRTLDGEYLDWLASWFGTRLDPALQDEARKRLFLKHAIELFNQRGTPSGLIRTLRLILDPYPDDSLFEDQGIRCDLGDPSACGEGTKIVRHGIRLVEQFLTRSAPGVFYGDPTDAVGPGLTEPTETWTPQQGAEPLHQRYRDFLKSVYEGDLDALLSAWTAEGRFAAFDDIPFAPVPPSSDGERADWRTFVQRKLGFTYSEAHPDDEATYQNFLRRRYRIVERLNQAYQRSYDSFGAITLPAEDDFPKGSKRLFDWTQFVSLVLPLQRQAHRFSVLVPTEPGSDLAEQAERLALVERVVDEEKPAHTSFEVKPYWALFRVGTARLGLDSLLDEGSRYVALLLGQSSLSTGYLGSRHPWDVIDRIVTGRDSAGAAL